MTQGKRIAHGSRVIWTKRDLGVGRVLDHNGSYFHVLWPAPVSASGWYAYAEILPVEPEYKCSECGSVMRDADASASVLCDACNATPAIHSKWTLTGTCDDPDCVICRPPTIDERIECARGTIRVLGPEAPIYSAFDWEATPTGLRANSTESLHGSSESLSEAVEAAFRALWLHDASEAPAPADPLDDTSLPIAYLEWPEPASDNCGEWSLADVRAHMAGSECRDISTEWLHTRRGLVGLSRVETERPANREPFVSWVWFTETGETGSVDGDAGRAMAITEAYVSMVRSGHNAPNA